jgi:hypothetical protein
VYQQVSRAKQTSRPPDSRPARVRWTAAHSSRAKLAPSVASQARRHTSCKKNSMHAEAASSTPTRNTNRIKNPAPTVWRRHLQADSTNSNSHTSGTKRYCFVVPAATVSRGHKQDFQLRKKACKHVSKEYVSRSAHAPSSEAQALPGRQPAAHSEHRWCSHDRRYTVAKRVASCSSKHFPQKKQSKSNRLADRHAEEAHG